jgi:hypothetical protein
MITSVFAEAFNCPDRHDPQTERLTIRLQRSELLRRLPCWYGGFPAIFDGIPAAP